MKKENNNNTVSNGHKWLVSMLPKIVPFKVVIIVTILYLLYCKNLTRCNTLSLTLEKHSTWSSKGTCESLRQRKRNVLKQIFQLQSRGLRIHLLLPVSLQSLPSPLQVFLSNFLGPSIYWEMLHLHLRAFPVLWIEDDL